MAYYADLREFIGELERRGKLRRWKRSVCKDTELMPLFRLQFRGLEEAERKAFLFENVTDARGQSYAMQVLAGSYGGSREIFALGLGCERPEEIYEKWHDAMNHPIEPVIVESGPVQEEVHLGQEIQQMGLDELPAPVEEPGYSGTIRTTTPFITRDPETGIRNVGTYSGHFRARHRMMAGIGTVHHAMIHHWRSAGRQRRALPVAITVGVTPNIVAVGSANIPYGIDELAVAGGIAGRAVELVRCKTVPLEVPATAEIVIEGEISTETMEPYTAFGEYPGYMAAEKRSNPVIKVTAITHRKDAVFTPILVGLPPSESNCISRSCREMILYNFLKYSCNLPVVQEVCCPEMGGGWNFWVIRIKKSHPSQPRQVLYGAAGQDSGGKVMIVVDDDINPKDPDMVNWALSFSMQPHRDIEILHGRVPRLDPSGSPPAVEGERERSFPDSQGSSIILIDATRKWPYPPVALPKKEFMGRALGIWEEEGLPLLRLKTPWYGYTLGLWGEEDEENARLILQGEYLKLGEKMAKCQTRLER
jgi:4-hydroxy-3-polyprenylbenzoate decarboxylase